MANEQTCEYDYTVVDVFTQMRLEGNPLAVFPAADGIAADEMQRIAGELNLSETAFITKPSLQGAVARVRIFTPRRELTFAGHPTIGSAYVLRNAGITSEHFAVEESVGLVNLDVDAGGGTPVFWLTTPPLAFYETLDPSICARLLNLPESDVAERVPPQFVSAGSPLLFICLSSCEAVDRAELQQAYLYEALGSANSVGTFVFAQKAPGSVSCFDVYSRMFAPQTGIPEDPATGGAAGPLAGYMQRYGLLPPAPAEFTSEQGVKMGRRSVLRVRVDTTGEEPSIKVGGSVVTVARGQFLLDA